MGSEGARDERSATRNDVARLAGVSTAVVSYVVNDGPRPVAEATRQRVLDAIDKLGYRPNAPARWLTTGKADLIALIVPDLQNPYFAALAHAVEMAAHGHGKGLILTQSHGIPTEKMVDALSGLMVAGIICSSLPSAAGMRALVTQPAPVVVLSIAGSFGPFPAVWPDFDGGTRDAVRHLVEAHGHTNVALITGTAEGDGDRRELAWRDVLTEHGLSTDAVVRTAWSKRGGRDAAEVLRRHYPHVTAAYVSSDQQAVGLIGGLSAVGISVPRDLAVASFDGSPEAEFSVPPLTTAGSSLTTMASDAVAGILGKPVTGRSPYPTQLAIRESCGCRPQH